MKGSLKNTNLIFRLMCFLLVVTSFTCIALAKYISSMQNSNNIGVSNIRCSVSVDLDSTDTVAFFNAPYVINDVIMNYPQKTGFLINNCDLKEDGTYSEPAKVDLKYDLIFYIPREFAALSALQISKMDEINREDIAVTQLYLLEDFIGTNNQVEAKGTFSKTVKDEKNEDVVVDYGSLVYPEDEIFTLSGGESLKHWQGDKNTDIIIETVKKDANLKYVFQTFNHNPSKYDYVVRHAPLYVTRPVKDIEFYKIRISRPEFVLKANERQDCNYTLRITTTREMTGASDHQDAPYGISFNDFNAMSGEKSMVWENNPCTVTNVDGEMWTLTNGIKEETLYIDTFIK